MEFFVFWIIFSIIVGGFANSKGRSGFGYFLLAILISPLLGFIIVAISEPIEKEVEEKKLAAGAHIKCQFCAELIKSEAIVCKHCGRDIVKATSAPS